MPTPDLLWEPKVYLVGRQSIDEAQLAAFLADEGVSTWETDTTIAGERLVEIAGRLCYSSYAKPRPGGHEAYIGNILSSRHGSVVEHAVFNLIVVGVSRSLSHELVRHRVGMAVSQLSQRYVDESAVPFVVPPALADEVRAARAYMAESDQDTAGAALHELSLFDLFDRDQPSATVLAGLRWLRAAEADREDYRYLSDYLAARLEGSILDKTARRKAAREAARSVLPNAAETKLFLTFNGRALRSFLELRGGLGADAEIRRLAVAIHALMKPEAPDLLADVAALPGPDGGSYLMVAHHKV
jgi:thymidylate synthase (FAD)